MVSSSSRPTRKGLVTCACKRVELHMVSPPDSYEQLEMLSVMCHCHDCVGFPTTLVQASKKMHGEEAIVDVVDRSCNAVNHLFFYQSDITVVKGRELIAWHKLSPDTYVKRCYTKCCLTPLGFEGSDVTTCIYGKIIRPLDNDDDTEEMVGDVFPAPTVAFFRKRAPKDSGPCPESIKRVCSKDFAPVTIYRFSRRDALGRKLNKWSKDGLACPENQDEVGVGWDSLHQLCEDIQRDTK